MKKSILIIGVSLILGGVSGYFYQKSRKPFALDYGRVVINVPVTHHKSLEDKTYPLGEKYLAEDMAAAFNQLGVQTEVYTLEDMFANKNFKEGFDIYMRAYPELQLKSYHGVFDQDKVSVLFETIPYKIEEVKNADIVFTGSLKKNREYRSRGINSYFMPQFTRFDKFYPAYSEKHKTKLLFIGNLYPEAKTRKTVDLALKNGLELDIYGSGWGKVLPKEKLYLHKGVQIPGDELKYYYSSADIVFNDTREDMIEAGFIPNRIFDVTAAKGFLISDYMAEIEEIYGDAIVMYKNEAEFLALVTYYLNHPEERKKKAYEAYLITKRRFGAKSVVSEMFKVMKAYVRDNGLGEDDE
ncbi:MAG: glycosyltransferase [Alphaproteobacteria bacterium]|nr:glycosyltransferase [Alphaproteobacteria bacterium]